MPYPCGAPPWTENLEKRSVSCLKTTIKMIAQEAQVSIATVSMVLNKKDARISDKTRQKVLAVATALEYRPNVIARSLVTSETRTVGLLIPDVANPFFAQIARWVECALRRENYNLFLCNSGNDKAREQAYLCELMSRSIDGLIVSSVNGDAFLDLQRGGARSIPTVAIDRLPDRSEIFSVLVADEAGGALAAREFLRAGHRRMACLCGPLAYGNIRARVQGFRQTLAEANVTLPAALCVETELTIEGGYAAAKRLCRAWGRTPVTGVFCANDLTAFGAYKAFAEAGLSIPEDLSVIGFDNIEFSQYLRPALTTIAQPIRAIGEKAVSMLLRLMQGEAPQLVRCVFPVELIARESVRQLCE